MNRSLRAAGVLLAVALSLLVPPGCERRGTSPTQGSPHSEQTRAEAEARARAAIGRLRSGLSAALMEAMKAGPEAALEVCKVKAPELAAQAGSPGLVVGRTSYRLRNPANKPKKWLLPLIQQYRQTSHKAGALVDLENGRLGYVEPIYAQGLCLTCHGRDLAPGLKERLARLYPEDQAAGFAAGDLRGLFFVEMDRSIGGAP